ncbi:MAG: DUF4912 domain-containing protein [Candidatus Competibacteraceae bacterium]|nr:DUF4912 domain-containing protein [Candidatus Competibacteraceae bacterium]
MLSQERLRTIIWEISQRDPVTPAQDFIVLNMVHPRLGHAYWHVRRESVDDLAATAAFQQSERVLRIYDVTDADSCSDNTPFFDLDIQQWVGNYYFGVDRTARHYLAEVGLRSPDGLFKALVRSAPTFFDRDQPVDRSLVNPLLVEGNSVVGRSFFDYFGTHLTEQGSGSIQ